MKRYVLTLCLLSVCCLIQTTHAQSPTTANNYIMESVPRSPLLTVGGLTGQPVESVNRTINYFDGLGRPLQTVLWQGSPLKRDIVTYMEYDSLGMKSTQYLPYAEQTGNNGSYKPTAQTNQADYYKTTGWDTHVKKTDFPFFKTVFERSPAARTLQQGAPGAVWQPATARSALTGRTQILEYGVNGINEVRTWGLTGSGATATGYYARGTLHKTIIKDENWVPAQGKGGTREEFRDFDQLLVLVREWEDNTQALNTYYVYDRAGLLRYTVPPGFSATSFTEASAGFDQYIYAYKYDDLGRMIEKKLPGKGWEWTVYNHSDLPVLTQDAVQRTQGKWTYTKHDRFSRIIGTGIHTGTYASPQAAQFHLDSLLALNGARWESRSGPTYTNLTFPNTNLQPLTTHYYDDYSFADASSLPAQGITPSPHIRNLQTGILIRQVDGTAPLLTVYYYDDKARMIQSAAQNHLGGTDYTTNTYSFTGELLSSKAEHRASPSGAVTTVLTTHYYDHQGRLLDTRKKVNIQAELIQSRLAYNGIGQLRQKQLHSTNNGSTFAGNVDYSYNERGWLTKSASGHFTQELRYDQPTAGATAQYNGNIAEQHWGHGTTTPNRFVYAYDALDRLTSGISSTSAMSESMAYDNMGNITSLTRDGGTAITYSYSGNRLTALSGGISGSYTYDVNGNALTDRNGLTYTYNHLNLPVSATKSGTSVTYTYDALGRKMRSVGAQSAGQTRDYVGGFEYVGGVLERIHSEEGYISLSGSTSYHYYQQDHLGNVRSVLTPSGSSFTVIQQQDYYPYGLRKSLAGPTQNLYLYNGKEIQGELGGQYDFGARMLDPVIGRWNVVDPLAEVQPNKTPYHYTSNNPINRIDPTGMLDHEYDKDGNKISDLGGDKIDFHHQANGDTKIVDKQTGASNIIAGGEALIRGYTQRDNSTGWGTLFNEWDQGTGPTKSMFADFDNTSTGVFGSFDKTFSVYAGKARADVMNGGADKGRVNFSYGDINPLTAGFDGWEQFIGRANLSYYKLGDKVLYMMNDSKSMTSFLYRMSPSWERSDFRLNGNTYQTYIWTETMQEVQNKNQIRVDYINQLQKARQEYRNTEHQRLPAIKW